MTFKILEHLAETGQAGLPNNYKFLAIREEVNIMDPEKPIIIKKLDGFEELLSKYLRWYYTAYVGDPTNKSDDEMFEALELIKNKMRYGKW